MAAAVNGWALSLHTLTVGWWVGWMDGVAGVSEIGSICRREGCEVTSPPLPLCPMMLYSPGWGSCGLTMDGANLRNKQARQKSKMEGLSGWIDGLAALNHMYLHLS